MDVILCIVILFMDFLANKYKSNHFSIYILPMKNIAFQRCRTCAVCVPHVARITNVRAMRPTYDILLLSDLAFLNLCV